MSRYELEVRHPDGEYVGAITWRDGVFQVDSKSDPNFVQAIDFLFSGPKSVSYWDGEVVRHRSLEGGTLDAIDALSRYLEHNFKFKTSVPYVKFATQLSLNFETNEGERLEVLDSVARHFRTIWYQRRVSFPNLMSSYQPTFLDRKLFKKVSEGNQKPFSTSCNESQHLINKYHQQAA